MKLAPWLLAAVLAAAVVVLAVRGRAPAPRAPAPVVAVPAVAPIDAQLAALRRCQDRLQIVQASLDRSESIRRGERVDTAAQLLGSGGPCAGDLAAQAELEARIDAEVEARLRELGERRTSERESRRAQVRTMVEEFLAVDPTTSRQVMDYVCAVREQRADMLDEVRSAHVDLKTAADQTRAQRQDIIDDLERLLGKDKYQQLKSVGGLGKLGDLFECS